MPEADGQASSGSFSKRIDGELRAHGHKTDRTLREQKEYLISAKPSWGPKWLETCCGTSAIEMQLAE